MIAGALKSGRTPTTLRSALVQIAVPKNDKLNLEEFKQMLKETLGHNKRAGKIAVASLTELLETRKLFLQRQYKELQAKYREADPMGLTSEAVLLLFLSAVELDNGLAGDRWGQEIKRRYARRDVLTWVNTLTVKGK